MGLPRLRGEQSQNADRHQNTPKTSSDPDHLNPLNKLARRLPAGNNRHHPNKEKDVSASPNGQASIGLWQI